MKSTDPKQRQGMDQVVMIGRTEYRQCIGRYAPRQQMGADRPSSHGEQRACSGTSDHQALYPTMPLRTALV